MGKNLENQVVIIGPCHPFNDEEEKMRERDRTEELKPILDELEKWRAESIYGPWELYDCVT